MKLSVSHGSFFRSSLSIAKQEIVDKYIRFFGKKCGIYCIRNKITNDRYIGQSKNVAERLSAHKTKLKYNNHLYKDGNPSILQKGWNKYGENNFEFKIIEFCDEKQLNEREQYWIRKFECNRSISGKGYNLNNGGAGRHNNCVKNSKKIIVNNGIEQKQINIDDYEKYNSMGYIRGLLPKNKDKINASRKILRGEEHPHYGKKWSNEHRKKVEEFYSKRENYESPRKGVPLKQETINKIKETWKNKKPNENSLKALHDYIPIHKRKVVQISIDDIEIEIHNSINEASIKTGAGKGNIVSCCKGSRKTAGGFKWRYADE